MLILIRDAAIPVTNRVTITWISRRIRNIPTEVVLDEDDRMPARCVVSPDDLGLDNLGAVPKALLVEPLRALEHARMRPGVRGARRRRRGV